MDNPPTRAPLWSFAVFKREPLRYLGRAIIVFLRIFNGLFYFAAGVNKLIKGWLWSDMLKTVFEKRLTEIPADSFGAMFLTNFGIPLYVPTAYVVTSLELLTGASLLLGLCSRLGAAVAIFLNLLIGMGGYYDASLIALDILLIPLVLTPSGHWFGRDRTMHAKNPTAWWFK